MLSEMGEIRSLAEVRRQLHSCADPEKALILQGFFKTGPGQYGEGDKFLGVVVPRIRRIAGKAGSLSLSQVIVLLKSEFHEERLLALLVLVSKYNVADERERRRIYDLYLRHTRYINSWDLVDLSAHHIVGAFLSDKSRRPLYKLARSSRLWERRIAMISTFYFIRRQDLTDTFNLADRLLGDEHDLMHKAVGWMLREAGKRDAAALKKFLGCRYNRMPRTMLRYAIERFPRRLRQAYLKGIA